MKKRYFQSLLLPLILLIGFPILSFLADGISNGFGFTGRSLKRKRGQPQLNKE